MVYLGLKDGKANQPFHNLRNLGGVGDVFTSLKALKERVNELRGMSLEELEVLVTTKALRDFKDNTVLIYDGPRECQFGGSVNGGGATDYKMWVVNYETIEGDGKLVRGEVYVPARYGEVLRQCPRGVMIYRGMCTTTPSDGTPGVDYYALDFLSVDDAELALQQ